MKNGKTNKKILFAGRYNPSEILTGPEKAAKRIFHEHIKHDKSIFIQYFFDGGKYNYFKKLFGKEIVYEEGASYVVTLGIVRIFFEVYKYRPDIIHFITFERFSIILFLFKLFKRTKYIYNLHGIISIENDMKKLPPFYKFKERFCEKYFHKHSDLIVCPSEKYAALSHKLYNFNNDKVRIIPHGCDIEFSTIPHIPGNKHLNLAVNATKLGFNDSSEFLKKILEGINSQINLYVIIDSDKTFFLRNSNINIFYKNLTNTQEFAKFLSGIDILLSLNRYDTFSIIIIEAMAAGVIPIVTEETGMSSYIINGINGYKSSFGDDKYFLNTIEYLSNNKDKISELSNNARKIYSELNWEKVYDMYSLLYKNIS